MAVEPVTRLTFEDFSAWVCVNGEPTPVYSVSVNGGTTSCFIEAEEEAPFAVMLMDDQDKPVHGLASRVWIDGTKRTASIVGADDASYQQPRGSMMRVESFYGARASATSEKPFVFSKLLLTDDADLACSDEAIIKGLGTIQLKIYRVGNVVASSAPAVDATGAVAAFVVVHERLKKATLSHQTGYGEAVTTTSAPGVARYSHIDQDPYHVFEFRYLNRDLLELKGHIPEEKEPEAAPAAGGSGQKRKTSGSDDEASGEEDGAEDVEDEIASLQAKLGKLERRKKMADSKRVKREQGPPVDE